MGKILSKTKKKSKIKKNWNFDRAHGEMRIFSKEFLRIHFVHITSISIQFEYLAQKRIFFLQINREREKKNKIKKN